MYADGSARSVASITLGNLERNMCRIIGTRALGMARSMACREGSHLASDTVLWDPSVLSTAQEKLQVIIELNTTLVVRNPISGHEQQEILSALSLWAIQTTPSEEIVAPNTMTQLRQFHSRFPWRDLSILRFI